MASNQGVTDGSKSKSKSKSKLGKSVLWLNTERSVLHSGCSYWGPPCNSCIGSPHPRSPSCCNGNRAALWWTQSRPAHDLETGLKYLLQKEKTSMEFGDRTGKPLSLKEWRTPNTKFSHFAKSSHTKNLNPQWLKNCSNLVLPYKASYA